MKRFYHYFIILSSLFCGAKAPLYAQSEKNSVALPTEREYVYIDESHPIEDIYGSIQDFRQYNKEGKGVLIECCGYWSIKGWELHKEKRLRRLYEKYGPAGSDQIQIFWQNIDQCDLNTLKGKGEYCTTGDWTDGGTVPYPILNSNSYHTEMGLYFVFAPRFFYIEPTGWRVDITNILTSDNYEEQFSEFLANSIAKGKAPVIHEIDGFENLFIGEKAFYRARVRSAEPITGIEWQVDGGAVAPQEDGSIIKHWKKEGDHVVSVKVSNKYGSVTATKSVHIQAMSSAVVTFPITFDFDNSQLPPGWLIYDRNKDGYSWLAITKDMQSRIGIKTDEGLGGTKDAFASYTYYMDHFDWKHEESYGYNTRPDDWLITPLIFIPDSVESAEISFLESYFYKAEPGQKIDGYKVLLSTDGLAPEDFKVTLLDVASIRAKSEEETFFLRKIDLSDYKGRAFRIAFVHPKEYSYPAAGTGIIIDQVTIKANSPEEMSTPNVTIDFAKDCGEIELMYAIKANSLLKIDQGDGKIITYNRSGIIQFTPKGKVKIFADHLQELLIDNAGVKAISFGENPDLEILDASENEIQKINLSNLTSLKELFLEKNSISNIDISSLTHLRKIDIAHNKLKKIDLLNSPELQYINIAFNEIRALDLSKNKTVKYLHINDNKIENLDASSMKDLSLLLAANNRLSNIDLSANRNLTVVDLRKNELSLLALKYNTQIAHLLLDHNRLTELDLSANNRLITISCAYNKVASLDVSNSPQIQEIFCDHNQIRSLHINVEAQLRKLVANNNEISDLIMNPSYLWTLQLHNNSIPPGVLQNNINMLPDVKNLPIDDNNKGWAKQLIIRNNPGVANVDVSTALSKGWIVSNETRNSNVDKDANTYFRISDNQIIFIDSHSTDYSIYNIRGELLQKASTSEKSRVKMTRGTYLISLEGETYKIVIP